MSRDRCRTLVWSGGCSLDTPFLSNIQAPRALSDLSSPVFCLPTSVQAPCHYPLKALNYCRKSIPSLPGKQEVLLLHYCPALSKVIILITSFKRETKSLLILSHLSSLSPLTSQNKGILLEQNFRGWEGMGIFFLHVSYLFCLKNALCSYQKRKREFCIFLTVFEIRMLCGINFLWQ